MIAPIPADMIDVTLSDASGYPPELAGEDTRDQMMSAVGDKQIKPVDGSEESA